MNHIAASTLQLNQYRRFGTIGPVYQIVGFGQCDEFGDEWLKIVLVESGEETEYKAVHAVEDPVEG